MVCLSCRAETTRLKVGPSTRGVGRVVGAAKGIATLGFGTETGAAVFLETMLKLVSTLLEEVLPFFLEEVPLPVSVLFAPAFFDAMLLVVQGVTGRVAGSVLERGSTVNWGRAAGEELVLRSRQSGNSGTGG